MRGGIILTWLIPLTIIDMALCPNYTPPRRIEMSEHDLNDNDHTGSLPYYLYLMMKRLLHRPSPNPVNPERMMNGATRVPFNEVHSQIINSMRERIFNNFVWIQITRSQNSVLSNL